MQIPFRDKEIECNFTWICQGDVSLVIDIIRHYGRIVFRGFAVVQGQPYDFSRQFPFPPRENPFSGRDGGDFVSMDLEKQTITGTFRSDPSISFDLQFTVEDYYFSATKPGWLGRIPFLNRFYQSLDLTKGLSLLQEDFPLVTFSGDLRIGGTDFPLHRARGAILHHWGWYFPDYLCLVCNGFEDPDTLLTGSFAESITSAGLAVKGGYLYLHQRDREKRFVSPFKGKLVPFYEEGAIVLAARFSQNNFLRIRVDPGRGKSFPHIFNNRCMTVLDADCEIKGIAGGGRGVLDIKGLDMGRLIMSG